MRKVKVLIGWDRNYSASCDDAPGCVATAATLEGIKKEFASALEFHLKGMREDGDEIPAVFECEYELDFELNGRALVHYAEGLVDRGALARLSGINRVQLGHYLAGRSTPRPQQVERIKSGIKAIAAQLSALSL